MKVKFKKLKEVKTPTYGTEHSAGMDFYLPGEYAFTLQPGLNKIDLGIAMEIPEGHVLLLKEKSGLTVKHEMIKIAGVIDADYRGSISVMYFYPQAESGKILGGSKIVQGIIVPIVQAEFEEVSELTETIRGDGGYGSTGE